MDVICEPRLQTDKDESLGTGGNLSSGGAVEQRDAPGRLMTGPYLARNPKVVALMKIVDLLGRCLPRRSRQIPQTGLRVLVTNMAHMGDLVVILPLLEALKSSSRVAEVGVLIGSWGQPVMNLWGRADHIHICDHWLMNRAGSSLFQKVQRHIVTGLRAVRQTRRQRYDIAIDSYAYFGNSAALIRAAGAAFSVGFKSGGGGTLYSSALDFDPSISIVANQARLLSAAGLSEPDPSRNSLVLHTEQVAVPGETLDRSVVFHVGPGRSEKDWPAESWIALGKRLQQDGLSIVFTGSAGEAAHSEAIRDAIGGRNLIGALTFPALADLLTKVSAVVSIDTVTSHLAVAAGTPTVVVTPGILPKHLWHPDRPGLEVLSQTTQCSPCMLTSGCRQMTCLRDVTPDAVYSAVSGLMHTGPAGDVAEA